jgi:adenosylcobinamide-phosphate synthase
MSFISALFALLLEQARPLGRGNLIHATLRSWVRWSAANLDAGKPAHGWMVWGFAAVSPALLSALIYWALMVLVGWPVAVLWSSLVLYACVGFRQFSFNFTRIRDAFAVDDEPLARNLLAKWQQVQQQSWTRSEMIGRVIEFSVLASHRHVFGVLVWFSILAVFGLGPAGAVLYRVSEFVARYWRHQSEAHYQPVSMALQRSAQQAWEHLDWLPVRMTALGFAVVGNFEEAVDGWRQYIEVSGAENDGLLLAAAAGAMNVALPNTVLSELQQLDQKGRAMRPPAELAHLVIFVGLVWRTVVLWVLLLALLTLARLLG